MTLQKARKYILPASVVLLLAALAVWGFQQRPAGAVVDGDNAAAVQGALPSGQYAAYPYDVVQVTGMGKATGVPDLATLSLGISVTDATVAAARSRAAAALQSVRDALTANNVAAKDIATTHFSIYPEYDYSQSEGRTLAGYMVSNGVTVTVRDTGDVGAIIDAAIAAGGNDIVFNDLRFAFSDTTAMERQAREEAVTDMASKAAQLAEFAGRELGDLKLVSETSGGSFPVAETARYAMAAAPAPAYDTPISVGEGEIAVTVYGVYELR